MGDIRMPREAHKKWASIVTKGKYKIAYALWLQLVRVFYGSDGEFIVVEEHMSDLLDVQPRKIRVALNHLVDLGFLISVNRPCYSITLYKFPTPA